MKNRLIILIVASIFTLSHVLSPDKVFAGGIDYSSNDILFYDKNDCVVIGTGSTILVGNDNAEKAFRFFAGKGLSNAQTSGIIGNLMAESGGVDPKSIQSKNEPANENYSPENGVGFGIAQWTFTDRQKPLIEYAKSSNRSIIDLSMQLDFMWKEMTTSRSKSLTELKKANAPLDATISFHKYYEGSADSEEKVKSVRGAFAQQAYEKYSASVPDSTNNKNTDIISCTGNGEASTFINGFAIYNQNDTQWSNEIYGGSTTIGEAGCGPSAMAMIITALTNSNVTPLDTAKYGSENGTYVDGHGSSHNIASVVGEHWGLKSNSISADEASVNEVLRSGGLILAVATGSAPYTSYGHFIVVRAVTESGKWLIGDSNGQGGIANSAKEWDPSIILDGGVNGVSMWALKS